MIFQHFMECIFHFNDYKDHAGKVTTVIFLNVCTSSKVVVTALKSKQRFHNRVMSP